MEENSAGTIAKFGHRTLEINQIIGKAVRGRPARSTARRYRREIISMAAGGMSQIKRGLARKEELRKADKFHICYGYEHHRKN